MRCTVDRRRGKTPAVLLYGSRMASQTASTRAERESRPARQLAIVLFGLGIGVAAATLLGPLGFHLINYHVVDDLLNQIVGGDAIGLILVAPAALAAGVLTLRSHPAGPVVALAPAGYAIYVYTQLTIGGEFASRPGNSERFFPLFLAVFLLGGAAFVMAWNAVDQRKLPEPSVVMRRTAVTVIFFLAAFLTFGLHLPGLVDVIGGAPYGVEYTQSPTVFWIVKLMDLGIVVPVAIVTGVGILRGATWAKKLMYTVIGWGALLATAVAGMGVVMMVNDDPAASSVGTAVFVGFGLALLALAVWLFKPLFTTPGTAVSEEQPPSVTVG